MTDNKYNRALVYVKTQPDSAVDPFGTPGAYVYAAADVVCVTNPDWIEQTGENLPDEKLHNGNQQIPGDGRTARSWAFTLEGYMKGGGDATTESAWATLLAAGGLTLSTSTYSPDETNSTICTIHMYRDDVLFVANRVRTNPKISAEHNKQVKFMFDCVGSYTTPTDVTDPGTYIADPDAARSPIKFSYANLDIGTLTDADLNFSTFEFDCGNNMEIQNNANDGEFGGVVVGVKRTPTFSVNPLYTDIATYDFYSKWDAGGNQAFNVTFGDTVGNRYTLAGNCEPQSMSGGERNEKTEMSIDYNVTGTAGTADSDFTLVMS